MKITRKLAAIIAVFLIALCFSTVAYAAPEDASTEATPPPAESSENPNDFTIGDLPPGVGTVVDVFKDETGRKFYTIQTPAGNTFYLIIDTSRLSENVYFLDAVQEKDLIALAEKADAANGGNAAPGPNASSQPTSEPSGNQADPNAEPKDNTQNLIMFGVVLVVLIVGGGVYFIKNKKAKKSSDTRDEYEADEPDEYIPDNYETEPEDDSPPWEDEE